MKANLGVRPPATRESLSFRRMNARLLVALLLPALAACLAFAGQSNPKDKIKAWMAKDWTQWDSWDCYFVLNDSPWALKDFGSLAAGGDGGFINTVIQLRSALPIRQALVRQLQLQKRYDHMNAQKKQEYDQQSSADLAVRSDRNLVVVIYNSSTEPPAADHPITPLGPFSARQAALQVSSGTLILPIQINKVKYMTTSIDETMNQFECIFPRTINGRDLFTKTDSSMTLKLGAPLIVDKKTNKVELRDFQDSGFEYTFKFSDLMYKGKLEY
jgi:hypothetical protein